MDEPQVGARETRQARWLALLAITAIALYLCWRMLQPFVDVLIWAVVLVLVFFPVHQQIAARLRRPGLSALLSTLLVMTTVVAPLVMLVSALVGEVSSIAATDSMKGFFDHPVDNPMVQRAQAFVQRYVDLEQLLSPDAIRNGLAQISQAVVKQTAGVVGGVLGFVMKTFFVVFVMFYLFRDGDRAAAQLRDMLPVDAATGQELLVRTSETVTASVYGVFVIAIIQGTLGGLMFWILGMPSPLLWGVVMTAFSAVPMLGAFLVWVPAAIYLAVTGAIGKAILLTVWGAVVIGMVDNFLRPRLVGQRTRMHDLLIFFSVLGGLQVFGMMGLLIGPVIVAITMSLIDLYRRATPGRVVPAERTAGD